LLKVEADELVRLFNFSGDVELIMRIWLDGIECTMLDGELTAGRGDLFAGVRVMTTMLAIGQSVVDFDRHLDRLMTHQERMGFTDNLRIDVLRFDIEKSLVNHSSNEWSRLRLILFLDNDKSLRRLLMTSPESSELIVQKNKLGQKLQPIRESSWPKGSHIKTGMLGTRHIHVERAKKAGFDDVLWINGDGELAESTWSNIFLIGRTGDLVEIATPAPASGILEGITRRRVKELLEKAQIPVTERLISEEEIPRFDEAFVTSSVYGVVPVTQIGSHRLHTSRANAVFGHIERLYRTWLKTSLPSDSGGLSLN
jgi:branched-subunit amino acid aminotransferase/4-amino-4-deoxychorismate lyase